MPDSTVAPGYRWIVVVTILAIVLAVLPAVASAEDGPLAGEDGVVPQWALGGLLIDRPHEITHVIKVGQPSETIYGRIFVKEETEKPGPISGVILQVGFGMQGTRPAGWDTWQPMSFNRDYSPGDPNEGWEEWKGAVYPDRVGELAYLMRVSPDGGHTWYYTGLRVGTESPGLLYVAPSGDTTAPPAPAYARIADATPDSITVAWGASTSPDFWGYEVYRQIPGGEWSRIATVLAPVTTYVDRSVTTGSAYRYYVVAVDTSYNRSARSNEVWARADVRIIRNTFLPLLSR